MPFGIIRNDITKVMADAIVNTANPLPVIGGGTDSAIYEAAGKEELLAERRKIGEIPVGKAAYTPAFRLSAKYILHTAGPVWKDGNNGEVKALESCYRECLYLAKKLDCDSIAFPLISTGVYGFPKDKALKAATSVIYDFLLENDMTVYLVVFDKDAYDLSGKLFSDIQTYIDDHYALQKSREEYRNRISSARRREGNTVPVTQSLEHLLGHTEKSFSEYLMEKIIEKDVKNSDVYHGANISKQHFSKMISNPGYHPTKNTACALALSLHLTLDETNELLRRAGLVLTDSSKFDLVVKYMIENRMYNIVQDNLILDRYGLPLLGKQ